MRPTFRTPALLVLAAGFLTAQPQPLQLKPLLHLKTRRFDPVVDSPFAPMQASQRQSAAQSHLIVQFFSPPSADQAAALVSAGATVMQYVPDNALLISAPDGLDLSGLPVRWAGAVSPSDKLSPLLPDSSSDAPSYLIVEFYPDVDPGVARTLVLGSGASIQENPDLAPDHLMVLGTPAQASALAGWDEVAYIFPASSDLINGVPVEPCSSALTVQGPVGQYIPLIGDGWAGPGHGTASLQYAFTSVTAKLGAAQAQSEIVRAFEEWAKYIQVTFRPTSNTTAPRTLNVLFARGDHGDGYPFDGPGGVLAHTFFPAPPNPESIAGDLHFDDDENWHIGAATDVFSVALHETGHALGLGHSDRPGDVMYPYYKQVTGLTQDDISAAQQLYAVNTGPAAPLTLTVNQTNGVTTGATISLGGTASGGTGAIQVAWSVDQGPPGGQGQSGIAQGSTNWTIAAVPLNLGSNTVALTATDAAGGSATQTVAITRNALASPPLSPNPAPTPPPSNPPANPPTIQFLQPTTGSPYQSSSASVVISGTASQTSGIDHVAWVNSTGGGGSCSLTSNGTAANWSTGSIGLHAGNNVIVIRAYGRDGTTAQSSLEADYTAPTSPPDPTPPSITILSPSTTSVATSAGSIVVSGTASDNTGVTTVTWSTSNGASGSAGGTASWTTSAIPLLEGTNLITIRATDASGNVAWRTLNVARR